MATITKYKGKKKSEESGTKGLFSKSNKLPFMVKIKMAKAMAKKSAHFFYLTCLSRPIRS